MSSVLRSVKKRKKYRRLGEVKIISRRERWTPSFGQVFVTAKVESGVMLQATWG